MQPAFSKYLRKLLLRAWGTEAIKVEFDNMKGIPVVDYGIRCGIPIGRRVNPLFLSLYICKEHHLEHVTGPIFVPELREARGPRFVGRAVDWLRSLEKRGPDFSFWEYDFPWPGYPNLRPPWKSALTEAFGAVALLELGYKEDAIRHLYSLLVDHQRGGVSLIKHDTVWFLEYACQDPPLVLNGMLHCLLIMDELATKLSDQRFSNAFELAYRTMKRDLPRFDAGFYTLYDTYGNPADAKYHKLHIELLKLIEERRSDPQLRHWILRWERFMNPYSYFEPIIFAKHLFESHGALFAKYQ